MAKDGPAPDQRLNAQPREVSTSEPAVDRVVSQSRYDYLAQVQIDRTSAESPYRDGLINHWQLMIDGHLVVDETLTGTSIYQCGQNAINNIRRGSVRME